MQLKRKIYSRETVLSADLVRAEQILPVSMKENVYMFFVLSVRLIPSCSKTSPHCGWTRDKFLQLFGTSWIMPDDMEMRYAYTQSVWLRVFLVPGQTDAGNFIEFEFSIAFRDYLEDLDSHVFQNITAKEMAREKTALERKLSDPYETVFIPAGRNLITLLSKVDGEIFKKGAAEEKCDYLLLNDDAHKAYYIELKGSDIPKAIRQVENAIHLLHHGAIADYEVFCRIVYHTGSHSVRGNTALKWLANRKGKALIKERMYEENVS